MPWPRPDRPGYPADNAVRQFHLFNVDGTETVMLWDPAKVWWDQGVIILRPEDLASSLTIDYLGPAQVRLTPADGEEDNLARLIHKAAEQFRSYEAHHRAKGSEEKAEVNKKWAERLEAAYEAQ